MQGKIIKGIAGFYYVQTEDKLYECKAKGIFRNKKMKPLVGDNVEIDILDETEQEGNITKIYERHNELIRPAVSNVDQALIIFAAKNPKPNYNLLDRFLMMMEKQDVPVIVCFNKVDLAKEKELKLLEKVYENCGHIVRFISVKEEEGIDEIRELIHGKTTVLAGPSGVGKSSLMNLLQPEAQMETGEVSEKIKRGRHTTRHSELICIEKDTYVLDTPGFSSLFIHMFEEDEIKDYFQEFAPYEDECRFQGCSHTHEPDCGVKKALEEGKISKIRYDNYLYRTKRKEKMVMRVLILTGGTVEENFAKDYISKWNPDQVITADKGLLYAKRLNIKPDIILGDFDSCSKDIMQEFSTDKKIIVPCEKDDTDTGLAIQKAIETGADEILMIGGTGTRLDHVMGNFGQLFYAHSKGVKAELVDANNRIRVLNHEDTISKKDQFGKYVSLIPIYEARGVTLTGFKYPLKDHTLVFEQSLAISNELEAEEGIISFSEGKLLLIESRD